jgi:hypothetical protein
MPDRTEHVSLSDLRALKARAAKKGIRRTPLEPSEADIQASAVAILRQLGYVVMETGKGIALRKAGIGWGGNTPSCPDLFIGHPAWGNRWVAIECKRPGGAVRPGQQELADAGVTTICRSVAEILRVVEEEEFEPARYAHLSSAIREYEPKGEPEP